MTMAFQKILTQTYINNIFDDVEKGVDLNRFLLNTFPYDDNYLVDLPHITKPDGLLEKLDSTTDGDFKSAVAIYEAYKYLRPLEATTSQLWESLALTDLFPYMRERWNLKGTTDLKQAILNHFTVKAHGIMRHGLGGLWWLVYLTVDEDRANKYELTEILFRNYTLRFIRFGVGKVIQHKEAAIGILQFIKDHETEISSMENVANGLASYFNKLGAVKQLTYLDRDFFYHEMESHFEEFKNATTHYDKEDDNE